jgi:hypothetical protein
MQTDDTQRESQSCRARHTERRHAPTPLTHALPRHRPLASRTCLQPHGGCLDPAQVHKTGRTPSGRRKLRSHLASRRGRHATPADPPRPHLSLTHLLFILLAPPDQALTLSGRRNLHRVLLPIVRVHPTPLTHARPPPPRTHLLARLSMHTDSAQVLSGRRNLRSNLQLPTRPAPLAPVPPDPFHPSRTWLSARHYRAVHTLTAQE